MLDFRKPHLYLVTERSERSLFSQTMEESVNFWRRRDQQTIASLYIYNESIDNDAIHQLDKLNSFLAIAFELYSSMARALGL